MKPMEGERATVLPRDSLVPLESVLCTEELNRRPERPPDYETENRALTALVQALADSPRTILQTLADKILEVFRADSAGISLLTEDEKSFFWPAIAGMWQPHIGGGTPRDFGPCGDVLDYNAPLLFKHFERRYTYFLPVTPVVEECLLVPFYVHGKAVGTIWAIAHDDRRKFDTEDLRQLISLGSFASSAYQAVASLDGAEQRDEVLRQERTELAQRVAELQDARRSALNLMEDAIQSRETMETLNAELRESEGEREKLLASERLALAQAETANRAKDDFLATMSHELRTPLNAMMGWADILRRGVLDEQTAEHAAETIARNAKVQNQLISDLLDVSRIVSGKLRLERGTTDLIKVIEAAMDTVRPAADKRGVELRLQADPMAGLVSGDASRLQQVVWNLLSNAIKYSPRGGGVDVRLERQGTNVAVIVRDTGEGIRPEVLPYIFDRFRQADSVTTRRHGGLGLGLSIVQHLIEAHGGTIHADSGGVGQGATFTVTLPLIAVTRQENAAQPCDADEAAGRAQTPLVSEIAGARVLVVDDDSDNRELLRVLLSYAGAEIRVASTVRDALEVLDNWIPDVLVSDIGMPEEDGYALIKEVRAISADRGGLIPALALTGYATEPDATHAREAGFQMHLAKPVESAKLIAAVASLASFRQSRPMRVSGNPEH